MISHAYKALIANKLKTFLIIISLIFSIVSIFLISSISNGVISMYSSMLKSDGDIIITQAKISDTFFSNVDINLIKEIEYLKNINEAGAMTVGASPVEKLPIVAIYGVTQNRFKNYKLEKEINEISNQNDVYFKELKSINSIADGLLKVKSDNNRQRMIILEQNFIIRPFVKKFLILNFETNSNLISNEENYDLNKACLKTI